MYNDSVIFIHVHCVLMSSHCSSHAGSTVCASLAELRNFGVARPKINFLVLSAEKRVRRRNLKASAFMDQYLSLHSAVQNVQRIWLGLAGTCNTCWVPQDSLCNTIGLVILVDPVKQTKPLPGTKNIKNAYACMA